MDEICDMKQPGERRDPLGTPNGNPVETKKFKLKKHQHSDHVQCTYSADLKALEEEHEVLNASLCALTTHFAQVQLRLKQIVDAPTLDKENLIKSLEDFAFRGIPDIRQLRERMDDPSLTEALTLRRTQQQQLIEELKMQLSELERYDFESGGAVVPQDIVLESQRAILNELKARMNLDVDEQKFHQLTPADVKQQVDVALGQLVSPLRMKEHLVAQLKTQVADLERFIDYLQADTKNHAKCACGCSMHSVKKSFKTDTIGIVQRTAMLLQMFAMMHLGCNGQSFKKNNLKNTMKVNHWGDLRARLEMAISKIVDLVKLSETNKVVLEDYTSDSDTCSIVWDVKVTTAVRQYLAISLRDLVQHGAVAETHNYSVVPFIGCISWKFNKDSDTPIHAWEIILQYYHFKNGEIFNSMPARKLSRSFNLDIAGASPISNKQSLLSTIGNIISTHTTYKRSYDSHFKAFICAALNCNKLVRWLSLIFQSHTLINMHYRPWSYAMKTGFTDALQSLDVLTDLKFDLPVDLAIHQFQSIKDAFT